MNLLIAFVILLSGCALIWLAGKVVSKITGIDIWQGTGGTRVGKP